MVTLYTALGRGHWGSKDSRALFSFSFSSTSTMVLSKGFSGSLAFTFLNKVG